MIHTKRQLALQLPHICIWPTQLPAGQDSRSQPSPGTVALVWLCSSCTECPTSNQCFLLPLPCLSLPKINLSGVSACVFIGCCRSYERRGSKAKHHERFGCSMGSATGAFKRHRAIQTSLQWGYYKCIVVQVANYEPFPSSINSKRNIKC